MRLPLPAFAAVLAVASFVPGTAVGAENTCSAGTWTQVRPGFFERSGCLKPAGQPIRFQALAFNLESHELGLRGSRADGGVPSLDDVAAAQTAGNSQDYTLDHAIKDEELAVASIGYPEDAEYFSASGLVRIDGKAMADRDTEATFKNAMLCLNEAQYNKIGSRVIVFNAFEDFRPIALNERLDDETNCLDVVQVGPRVVDYRAKEGIKPAELKRTGQKWSVFAQGNGGPDKETSYLGYIFVFEDPIHLYEIQTFLLSSDAGHGDTKMRVAVAMTTDAYSGMRWRAADGSVKSVGTVSRPHPVFLTVKTFQP